MVSAVEARHFSLILCSRPSFYRLLPTCRSRTTTISAHIPAHYLLPPLVGTFHVSRLYMQAGRTKAGPFAHLCAASDGVRRLKESALRCVCSKSPEMKWLEKKSFQPPFSLKISEAVTSLYCELMRLENVKG